MDERSFRDFYGQTAPRLRAFIRRAGDSSIPVDDILQETFLRFLKAGADAFPDLTRAKAYLYRTASGLLSDYRRRRRREERGLYWAFWNRSPQPGAGLRYDIDRILARLSARDQMLLWLAYVEGFDHDEIAQCLAVGNKSVRVLLFRARRKMILLLEKEGFHGASAGAVEKLSI